MRLQFTIFLLIIVAAILALVFWHKPIQRAAIPPAPQTAVQSTNPSVENASVASQNVSNISSSTTPAANQKSSVAVDPRSPEGVKQYIESQNAPIVFYGKVIDQDSNALAGAKVKIGIRHWTMPDPAVLLAGSKEIYLEQTSDADGRFKFDGATGDGFGVGITKDGYELEQNKYGSGPKAGSVENPVIFKMWSTNIHERLIGGEKTFHIIPDGRPYFINLTGGTIAESGAGDLTVWVKRPARITQGQRYDWSCEVDITNGGLLSTSDSAMYLAPTEGYIPSFQFEQTIDSGWGDSTGPRRFYVMLNNGREYGRFTIELYAYYNAQIPGLIRLSYAINPSGSRILR